MWGARKKVYKASELWKDKALQYQVRKSCISVPSNIAEGHDRDTNREFIRFLYISKGSAAELKTQLMLAKGIGYLSEKDHYLISEYNILLKMIGKLIVVRKSFNTLIAAIKFSC